MGRQLSIQYQLDGFYGTWEPTETDAGYLLCVLVDGKEEYTARIEAPVIFPVLLYATETIKDNSHYEFVLEPIAEKMTAEYSIFPGMEILIALLKQIQETITEDRILILNQQLVNNEVWIKAWNKVYGTDEITISNVKEPMLILEESRLHIEGDGIQADFYAEQDEYTGLELWLKLESDDLQQMIDKKLTQGDLSLLEAFEMVGGKGEYALTNELGTYTQFALLKVSSTLFCRGDFVHREYNIELGQKDNPLIIWKDKMELLNWFVQCKRQEAIREDCIVCSSGISITGGFLIGQEKQADLTLYINASDLWTIYLECGEGNWFTALSNIVGLPTDDIVKVLTWLGKESGDFSLDFMKLTFSVSKNSMTAAEFAIRQGSDWDLFGTGLNLCNWYIFADVIKETDWQIAMILSGELKLGSTESAPMISVSVPLQEHLKQIVLTSGEKGIALPSIENLLSVVGVGDGSSLIPDEIYNLDDFKISQFEMIIDVTDNPVLQQYCFGVETQRELVFTIGNYSMKLCKLAFLLVGKDKEGLVLTGTGNFAFQQLMCETKLQVDCERQSIQMSVVFTKEEAEQIAFDTMADSFVEEELQYKNLPLPDDFSVPIFEKAVLCVDTGRPLYVMSGSLKNLGTCIFATSLDEEKKMGYVLVAALDEHFVFASLSKSFSFIDSIFKIQTCGIVLSTLNGSGIQGILGEIPAEVEIPSSLPQIDCEVKEGLFLYGKVELIAPVFLFLFGMAGKEKPALETSLYFPKNKEELFIRVALNELSLFHFLHFRQMEFMCCVAKGTQYELTGNIFLGMSGKEFGFGFFATGNTEDNQITFLGKAKEPIELGVLKLTDTEHIQGPGISFEMSRDRKVLGLTGGIVLFGEPFADVKSLGYDFKSEKFFGRVSYAGSISLFQGDISFTWDEENGVEIKEFPMHFIDKALDYAKLIEEAGESASGCKKIAGLIFEDVIQTEFTITPSFGGVDEKGMTIELLPQYKVSVAGKNILTASMNKLEVIIEKPEEIGFEALAELVVDAVMKNTLAIGKQLVNDMDNMTKLLAAMGTVKATEEAISALLCHGGKETVKIAVEIAKTKAEVDTIVTTASGGASISTVAAGAGIVGTSSTAISQWLEVMGVFFATVGYITIIGSGGTGAKDADEYKKQVEKQKQETEEINKKAELVVIEMLAINDLIIEQQSNDKIRIGWKPVPEEENKKVEYHVQISLNGKKEQEYIETDSYKDLSIEQGKETLIDVSIYAVYQHDDNHIYTGETKYISATVGKNLKMLLSSLPVMTSEEEYHYNLEAEGGCKPYKWSIHGFPEGIEICDQEICGITKYGGGEVYVDVTVTDALGNSCSNSFWLEVN